ncbi:hypothetical protein ACFFRR_007997 [Megaselia abdita]
MAVKVKIPGFRFVQTALMFLAVLCSNFLEKNVAIGLVSMTGDSTDPSMPPTFNWSSRTKQLLLSSFYWGFVVTQVPGGYLVKMFGSKAIAFTALFGSSLLSMLTTVLVNEKWQIFCAIRVAQGLFQGMLYPSMFEHLAKWSPNAEQTFHGTITLSGIDSGTVFAMGVGGLIAASTYGWPGIFYTAGGMGFFWCILWIKFGEASPEESRFITEKEKQHIHQNQDLEKHEHLAIPWRHILTSIPVYAMLFATCTQNWGYSTMISETSIYLNSVLRMDIESNAVFSALPHITSWTMSYVYLFAVHVLMKRKILSINGIRKIFNTISATGPAIILIILGFIDEPHKFIAVILIAVCNGFNVAVIMGCNLNMIDLSPNFVSLLSGLAQTLSNFVALLTPFVVAFVVGEDESDRAKWQIVFAISAGLFILGNAVFVFFGSTKIQKWNNLKS